MKHWEYHPEYVDGCFGCKGMSVQMNAGDADSRRNMPNKAFNAELNAYKEARAQGIQPNGTSMAKMALIGPRGYNEVTFAFGRFNTYTPDNAAGTTAKFSSTFKMYGAYGLNLHNG